MQADPIVAVAEAAIVAVEGAPNIDAPPIRT